MLWKGRTPSFLSKATAPFQIILISVVIWATIFFIAFHALELLKLQKREQKRQDYSIEERREVL